MNLAILLLCAILKLPTFIRGEDKETQISECGFNTSWIREIVGATVTETTKVAALGRVARLGDLYDARYDRFTGVFYLCSLPCDDISSIDNAYSSIKYVRTESILEKFQKLGVDVPLSVSFLGGMVNASGSGNYLNQDKKSATSAKTSLVYKLRTKRDDLKIFSESLSSAIDTIVLEHVDATHVVVGIEWGANVVLSLEETNTDLTNYKDVQRKLEETMDEIVLSATNSGHVDPEKFDVEKSSTFSVHLNSDIVSDSLPKTIKESIAFLRDVRNLIKTQNDGKGKIVNYILMPVQTVRKLFQVESIHTGIVNEIDLEISNQFLRIFQEIKDSQVLIKDAYDSFDAWIPIVPQKELAEVMEFNQKFYSFGFTLRKKLAESVLLFRSGKLYDRVLNELVFEYKKSNYTLANVKKFLARYEPTMDKIKLFKSLQSSNISFINRKTKKCEIIEKSYTQEISLISADLSNISSPFMEDLINSVKTESEKLETKFYIEHVPMKDPEIHVYLDGKIKEIFSCDEKLSSCFHDVTKIQKNENENSIDKNEYIFLKDLNGTVTIVDGNTLDQITNFNLREIAKSLVAIVNDTLYNIDTVHGKIMSTAVVNIGNGHDAVDWIQVGSFPKEYRPIYYGVAVNDSYIYFVTHSGVLYSYDTIIKTVTEKGSVTSNDYYASLVIADNILYIHKYKNFYSFDGAAVRKIATPEERIHSGLFQSGCFVCRVGGNETDIGLELDPVSCYNPNDETWTVTSYLNQYRRYPGITSTGSGTYVFGGWAYSDSGPRNWLNSAEIYNPKTKLWNYIQSPLVNERQFVQAVTFYF